MAPSGSASVSKPAQNVASDGHGMSEPAGGGVTGGWVTGGGVTGGWVTGGCVTGGSGSVVSSPPMPAPPAPELSPAGGTMLAPAAPLLEPLLGVPLLGVPLLGVPLFAPLL